MSASGTPESPSPAGADATRALFERAVAVHGAGELVQAEALYREVLSLAPDLTPAYANLGATLLALGRYAEAIDACSLVIERDPALVAARNTRGSALRALGRPLEALADFDAVLARRPDHAVTYNNRGNALRELGRYQEALASYGDAIAARPGYQRAIHNESLVRLLLGDFERGLALYESRAFDEQLAGWRRTFSVPRWSREVDTRGRTVLLHAEQGSGDAIQFARYTALVAARGAKVLLEVQPELVSLLGRVQGVNSVVANGEPLPYFDFECPLMSLPFAFGTRMDSIPANVPYVSADSERTNIWASRLREGTRRTIGVAWSGSAMHVNDRNRSIALSRFRAALAPGASYVSLQKDLRASDRDALARMPELQHFGDLIGDFEDTAALIHLMDLVVTVDTAVAHLAGAMGKPVWILLPFDPDWRGLLARDDSPWYPTARLLRQSAIGDWAGVLDRCRNDLGRRIAGTERV